MNQNSTASPSRTSRTSRAPRIRSIPVETKRGTAEVSAVLAPPPSFVRIFRGQGGYKLSTSGKDGKPRHLTAGELAWIASWVNGEIFASLARQGRETDGFAFTIVSAAPLP